MANQIQLPAILGSHPLGVLASFGLLRLVSERDASAKLGFTMEDDWVAFLTSDRIGSFDALIEILTEWAKSDVLDRVLDWADDVRVEPAEYVHLLTKALAGGDFLLANFLGAIAADGAVDAQKGFIKPSAFYMVSGQQSFLVGMRDIVAVVRSSVDATFKEALVGPWSYRTRAHSLGWDPNTERLYALRHRAPTSEKPSCIPGAVLLAFWSLPLFPALSQGRRPNTIGFTRDGRNQYFSWPIFSTPIGLFELTSILQTGRSGWTSADGRRLRPGLCAIYRSRRAEFGQGYAVLRAAQVVKSSFDSPASSPVRA